MTSVRSPNRLSDENRTRSPLLTVLGLHGVSGSATTHHTCELSSASQDLCGGRLITPLMAESLPRIRPWSRGSASPQVTFPPPDCLHLILAYVGTQSQALSPRGATQHTAPRGEGSPKASAGATLPSSSPVGPILLPSCPWMEGVTPDGPPVPHLFLRACFPGTPSWDNDIMIVFSRQTEGPGCCMTFPKSRLVSALS